MDNDTTTTSTTDSAAVEERIDPRELYARAVATARDVLTAIGPDDLADPTPCPDMDVETLASHLLMGVERVIALGNGTDPLVLPDTAGTPDGGWVAGLDAAATRAATAWSDPATLEREMWLPWAQGPGAEHLESYVAELTVHTWDLARALGVDPAWDDDVVETSWRSYRATFPDAERQARFAEVRAAMPPEFQQGPPPFADGIELPEGARLVDRVAAWTGRPV